MGAKKLWTEAEITQLRQMFEDGLSDREMSDALSRPLKSVKEKRYALRMMKDSGCEPKQRPVDFHLHAHETNAQLRERYAVSVKLIVRWRKEIGVVVRHNGWTTGTWDHKRIAPQAPVPSTPKRDKIWKHWGRQPDRVVDGSLVYQAVRHLQRYFVPVFRLNIQKPSADPNLYRVGTRTMTSGDMLDLAEEYGFSSSDAMRAA